MTATGSVRRAAIFIAIGIGIFLLQWGQQFLMPLVVAFLLMDVLTPAADWLRARRIPNVLAVTAVTGLVSLLVVGAIVLLSMQLVSLTAQLPDYRENIMQKVHALQQSAGAPLARLTGTYKEVLKELAPPATQAAQRSSTTEPSTRPVQVEVVAAPSAGVAATLLSLMLTPLGNAAIVFTLLFFLLLERDMVNHRLRWLMRHGDVRVSSESLDAASTRVATYLRTQLAVNVCYGLMIATSLWLVGLPNALLLGAIGAALRYIPYVGPLIEILLPTTLSIAIFTGWSWPLAVLGIMLLIEVFTNMVLETVVYGSRAGVSSTGVVLTCFFWGWIWGPMGLILAMPMTVWVVLVGRHLPGLRPLAITLSSEEVASIESELGHGHPLEPTEEGWAE